MMQATGKTMSLTLYPQVSNYQLRTYATDKNIADAKNKIIMSTKPPSRTASQFAEVLVVKSLRCGDVYQKHDLNETFMKRIDKSISQYMSVCWALCQSASLHDMALHAVPLSKVEWGQEGSTIS